MKEDLAVYLLVRNDLPSLNSSPGKMMAQAHHAGTQITEYLLYRRHHTHVEKVQRYLTQCSGFGTTIVLGASQGQLTTCVNSPKIDNMPKGVVVDPTYPFWVDAELTVNGLLRDDVKVTDVVSDDLTRVLCTRTVRTCAWFLVDRADPEQVALFADLKLF